MLNCLGRRLSLFGLAAFCLFIRANAQNAIKMTDSDGKESIFLLSSHPKVTHSDSSLLIETDQENLSCDLGEGVKFHFVDAVSTSVKDIDFEGPVVSVTSERIEASNLTPHSVVAIYDFSGKTLKSARTDGDGYVALSLSDLPKGAYIFNSKDKNFKFYKK